MQNKIQYLKSNIRNQNKGFTLIETLVTVMIFAIIITIASGIFISILRYQRRALTKQELLNQTSYVIEYMSRALRMAKKDIAGVCLGEEYRGYNYKSTYNGQGVKFINHLENDVCQEFYLEENTNLLKESKGIETYPLPLISDKLQINFLKFKLSGQSEIDFLQPRVTILLEAQVKGTGEQPKINIQTTVSQRNHDERELSP